MIEKAIKKLKLDGKRFLFIENVGNLVCPAGVEVGQHMNVVVSSTAEGSDKPKKYPIIFLDADMSRHRPRMRKGSGKLPAYWSTPENT